MADASASAPWIASGDAAPPRPGMRWIPPGTLIVGTPLDASPRVADAEMAGEQLIMTGYYIDVYPWPNEAGALPETNVSRDDAEALCVGINKRLCTEVELERACKGPDNTMYAYGPTFRPGVCGDNRKSKTPPNGLNDECVSAFGVADLQGSVWTWTSSDWGRGTEGLATVRGGSGDNPEVVTRCANGRGVKPESHGADIGVRCCAGPANEFQVSLSVERGDPLKFRVKDKDMVKRFEALLHKWMTIREGMSDGSSPAPSAKPGEVPLPEFAIHDATKLEVERTWTWHPIGNEELFVGGGCTKPEPAKKKECGVLVGQLKSGELEAIAFVSTGAWQPILSPGDTSRQLMIHGGDDGGAFRKRVTYEFGKLTIGERERKHKRGKHWSY